MKSETFTKKPGGAFPDPIFELELELFTNHAF